MKNFRKVLRNVSEADYERFYKIPKYGCKIRSITTQSNG